MSANSVKAMKEFMTFYADEALQKEAGRLIPYEITAKILSETLRAK